MKVNVKKKEEYEEGMGIGMDVLFFIGAFYLAYVKVEHRLPMSHPQPPMVHIDLGAKITGKREKNVKCGKGWRNCGGNLLCKAANSP